MGLLSGILLGFLLKKYLGLFITVCYFIWGLGLNNPQDSDFVLPTTKGVLIILEAYWVVLLS